MDAILDRLLVDILITEADILNLNNRSYTKDSLTTAVRDAQLYARLGLLTMYQEHPSPVYDEAGRVVTYNGYEKVPVGRFTKIWMDGNRVFGTAYLFNTDQGKEYERRIRNKEKINVSLRALGGCKLLANGKKICNVDRIEGCDIVSTPALPSAQILGYRDVSEATELITDSVCTPNNPCNNKCCTEKSYITNIYPDNVVADYNGHNKMDLLKLIKELENNGTLTDSMSELVSLLQRSGANEQVLNNFQAYLLGQESVQPATFSGPSLVPPPTEEELLMKPPPSEEAVQSALPASGSNPNSPGTGAAPSVPSAPSAAPSPMLTPPPAAGGSESALQQSIAQLVMLFQQFLRMEMAEKASEARKEMMPAGGEEKESESFPGEDPKLSEPASPSENTPPDKEKQPEGASGSSPPFESKEKSAEPGAPPGEKAGPPGEKSPPPDDEKKKVPTFDKMLPPESEETEPDLAKSPEEKAPVEEPKAETPQPLEEKCSLKDKTPNTNTTENIMDNNALLAKLNELMETLRAGASNQQSVATPDAGLTDEVKELVAESQARKLRERIKAKLNSIVSTGKVANFDLATIPQDKVTALVDKISTSAQSETDAADKFEFAVSNLADFIISEKRENLRKHFGNGPAGRSVSVEVISDADQKAWKEYDDKLEKAITDTRKRFFAGKIESFNAHAEVNSPFTNELLNEHDAINAELYRHWVSEQRSAVRDGAITDAALVIGNSDMRNMPIISRNIIKQLFQRLVALQYVQALGPSKGLGSAGAGGGPFGSEFKIPSVVYVPPTHNRKRYVGPTDPIPQSSSAIRFQSFWAQMRAIGFAIPDQLVDQLKNGALQIDPLALMIEQVTQDMARAIDDHLLEEFQQTCDEYGAVAVTGEVSVGGNAVYSSGGSAAITYDGATVTYGSGVTFVVKALSGASGGRPIVLPRTVYSLDAAGSETSTVKNPISVTFASTTQVRGELDADRQIVAINPGETPTYAVDFERGYFVFNAASGANGTLMPTLGYSYATNYVTFDLDLPSGVLAEDHYNALLNLSLQTAATMDAAPRYQSIDTALFPSTVGIGALTIAGLFHKRKQPDWVALNSGFATTDALGKAGPLTFTTTNGNMFAGDRRAILFKRYMTGYGVQMPAALDGPYNNMYAPSGGGVVQLTAGKQWKLQTRDAVGTPVPLNSSGVIMQHPGITIRFMGSVAS